MGQSDQVVEVTSIDVYDNLRKATMFEANCTSSLRLKIAAFYKIFYPCVILYSTCRNTFTITDEMDIAKYTPPRKLYVMNGEEDTIETLTLVYTPEDWFTALNHHLNIGDMDIFNRMKSWMRDNNNSPKSIFGLWYQGLVDEGTEWDIINSGKVHIICLLGINPLTSKNAIISSLIHDALNVNELGVVHTLLNARAEMHTLCNKPLLHTAIATKHSKNLIKKIIYAYPNELSLRCRIAKYTPILEAAVSGRLEILKLLIKFKCNVNDDDTKGRNVLCNTITKAILLHDTNEFNNYYECIHALLKSDCSVNFSLSRILPLHVSLSTGFPRKFVRLDKRNIYSSNVISIIKLLLQYKVNLNAEGKSSESDAYFSPLHYSVKYCPLSISTLLLQNKSDPNKGDINDRHRDSPLHTAFRHNNFDHIRLLLQYGANLQSENIEGKTPIDMSSYPFDVQN